MSHRFTKRAVLVQIERRCDTYANGFQSATGRRIDPTDGWVQCVDQGVEAAVNYGHWKALRDLADAIRAGEVVS